MDVIDLREYGIKVAETMADGRTMHMQLVIMTPQGIGFEVMVDEDMRRMFVRLTLVSADEIKEDFAVTPNDSAFFDAIGTDLVAKAYDRITTEFNDTFERIHTRMQITALLDMLGA